MGPVRSRLNMQRDRHTFRGNAGEILSKRLVFFVFLRVFVPSWFAVCFEAARPHFGD
jgi:hypothetical protein